MKKVWITALEKDEARTQKLMQTLQTYGLQAKGHFWTDDVPHMSWSAPADEILKEETALWIILASRASLAIPSVAYGLSLLAMQVFARKGQGFPLAIVSTDDQEEPLKTTLLKGATVFLFANPSLGVKMVTMANTPAQKVDKDYHLDIHAVPGIGLWLDVGPAQGYEWNGAFVGVHGGDIDFHAVGPRTGLPERSSIEYPSKGMKIAIAGDEFIAWGAKNHLDSQTSYFARLTGMPDRIIFGPYPSDDTAEVNIVTLF